MDMRAASAVLQGSRLKVQSKSLLDTSPEERVTRYTKECPELPCWHTFERRPRQNSAGSGWSRSRREQVPEGSYKFLRSPRAGSSKRFDISAHRPTCLGKNQPSNISRDPLREGCWLELIQYCAPRLGGLLSLRSAFSLLLIARFVVQGCRS